MSGGHMKPLVQKESMVQQFTNFNMTAVARVGTDWAHQLGKNIPACPDETRQDFLIIVSGQTKGKWLKRRPSTVSIWRALPLLREEYRGMCWGEMIGQVVQTEQNYSFCIFTRLWKDCEVQETFYFIDNRLVITAESGHLWTTVLASWASL